MGAKIWKLLTKYENNMKTKSKIACDISQFGGIYPNKVWQKHLSGHVDS